MNLLLVDDHALFREGLRGLLANLSPGLAIHECASVDAAVDECRTTTFRMVLLDLMLPETGGVKTLDSFRAQVPDIPVVVLSGETDPRHIRNTVEHGAIGFIPKSHTSDQMIAALRLVLAGSVYLPPQLLNIDSFDTTSDTVVAAYSRLSPRQQEVARLLLQGRSNKEIARQLGLSEGTVKAHVSAIFQIIGARNRVDAVMITARSGLTVM